ncbi:hypothetical protein ACJEBK_27220 [Peribacillus frigoritolerans]|uniref:hypothetical protein n=1 Tax=Peribacillus frigoritolerans TaxID=450367 RepID=UPI00387119B8
MLKIDRSELDKAIKNMVAMYADTEKVLADYEEEKQVLINRENGFKERMLQLQKEHTQVLLDRDSSKDNTSDYIKLSKKLTAANDDMQIIVSLQAQLKEDFKDLKQKYIPIIRDTYSNDVSAKNEFQVNDTIDYVKYELLNAIADYAKEVRKLQLPIREIVGDEFLGDSQLMQENKSFQRAFEFDSTYLSYVGDLGNSVIAKNHVLSSISGNLHPEVRKPVKDVE